MSLIITYRHTDSIFLASDTRITKVLIDESNNSKTEYDSSRKVYKVGDIGYYMCWGTFSGIKGKLNIKIQSRKDEINNIEELKNIISSHLQKNIEEDKELEFGVHIAGFENNEPKIFHVFHGINIESKKDIKNKIYKHHVHDHSDLRALYNGKQRLAHYIISFMIELEKKVGKKVISNFNEKEISNFLKMVIADTAASEETVGDSVNIVQLTKTDISDIVNTDLSEIDRENCLSSDVEIIPSGYGSQYNYDVGPTGSKEP